MRDGEQLSLDLFVGLPWEGKSPRALTRARSSLFLRPEPPGHEVVLDPLQLELWPVPRKATRKRRPRPGSVGALSLLPLKASRKNVPRRARWELELGD